MYDFCAIDFETANHARESVCSMSLKRVRDGRTVATTGGLIHPPEGFDSFVPMLSRIHKIYPRHVAGAPGWERVLPVLTDFVGGDVLVAHNAPFEASVIERATRAIGAAVPPLKLACSVKLARKTFPELSHHKLPQVVNACGVTMGTHHQADADTQACVDITVAMLQRGGFTSVEQAFAHHRIPLRQLA